GVCQLDASTGTTRNHPRSRRNRVTTAGVPPWFVGKAIAVNLPGHSQVLIRWTCVNRNPADQRSDARPRGGRFASPATRYLPASDLTCLQSREKSAPAGCLKLLMGFDVQDRSCLRLSLSYRQAFTVLGYLDLSRIVVTDLGCKNSFGLQI